MIVGIGVDIIEIERVREAVQNGGERFINRVYTVAEQEFCRARIDPIPHFAVRFAAKEALFKALGTGWAKGLSWQDVEVQRNDPEKPNLVLRGAAQKQSVASGVQRVHLSLSHSRNSAIALVILEQEES